MSLRAKIEAVVYAAEEPVTLVQLAAVFASDIREILQAAPAEQDASQSERQSVRIREVAQPEVAQPARPILPWTDLEQAENTEEAESSLAGALPASDTGGSSEAAAAAKRASRLEERAIRDHLRTVLDQLMAELQSSDRGVEIREIAGGYRMATKPEYHDAIRSFVKSLKPPMKLTLQALETLAVVAYKQPVTGPEISEIRGVESAGVLGSLIGRKLITTAGRKQVIGRPILYKTTKDFLLRFGLKDLNELPSIEEFEKMAGELAESDIEPTVNGTEPEPALPLTADDAPSVAEEPATEEAPNTHPETDIDSEKAGEA